MKDDIQTRLGVPVYDLSEMKVTYDYSDCTEYNGRGRLKSRKSVYVGFSDMIRNERRNIFRPVFPRRKQMCVVFL